MVLGCRGMAESVAYAPVTARIVSATVLEIERPLDGLRNSPGYQATPTPSTVSVPSPPAVPVRLGPP